MRKVLSIGHTTYDEFLVIQDAEIHCNIDKNTCSVCFGFGDKVPVKKAVHGIGGGAANVSAGLAKLGIDVSLFTYVGNDQYGKFLKKQLKGHGILLDMVVVDDLPTDFSAIISYDTDRTIFTYNHDRKFGYPKGLDGFDIIFVSSIGKSIKDVYDSITHYKKLKPRSLVIFSPGSKELQDSIDAVRVFSKVADIFIGNIEEGVRVFNPSADRHDVNLNDLLLSFQKELSNVVVLTDGAKGVYIGESSNVHHMESIPTKVVEKTGAGDAFASGFLAGKVNGLSCIEASKWGIVNSISMMKDYGAHSGLLDKKQLLIDVEKYWTNN